MSIVLPILCRDGLVVASDRAMIGPTYVDRPKLIIAGTRCVISLVGLGGVADPNSPFGFFETLQTYFAENQLEPATPLPDALLLQMRDDLTIALSAQPETMQEVPLDDSLTTLIVLSLDSERPVAIIHDIGPIKVAEGTLSFVWRPPAFQLIPSSCMAFGHWTFMRDLENGTLNISAHPKHRLVRRYCCWRFNVHTKERTPPLTTKVMSADEACELAKALIQIGHRNEQFRPGQFAISENCDVALLRGDGAGVEWLCQNQISS